MRGGISGWHALAWALKTGMGKKEESPFHGSRRIYLQWLKVELGEVSLREASEIKGKENSLGAYKRQLL